MRWAGALLLYACASAWAAPLTKDNLAEHRAALEQQEAKLRESADPGARQHLSREYAYLGAFLRYQLRRSDEAIAAYQASSRLRPVPGFDLSALHIADIYRFDKREARKAAEHYRLALASLENTGQPGSSDAMAAAGMKRWLERELDFVERGKRFSGAIGREDMGFAQLWLLLASQAGLLDPEPGPRALEQLPASQFQIARAYPIVLRILPPREMLAFFARHDPAGYLTASILALGARSEPAPYVTAAATTFFAAHGIRGSVAPDPRYASPEKTWALFIGSAKKGNADAMLACFTTEMGAKLQGLFKRMSRDELRKMGESFVVFALQGGGSGEFREAVIQRRTADANKAGFVHFLNDGGEWKIESM